MLYLQYMLHNPTKFQLSQIKTKKFQLKMFDVTVALKHGQGH